MWNPKNKTETDSQLQKTNKWLTEKGGVGSKAKQVKVIKRYKLPVMSWGYNVQNREYSQ